MDSEIRRQWAGLASAVLWGAALFMPAYSTGGATWSGWMCGAVGYMGLLTLTFGWYANLPWLIAVVMALTGARPSRIAVWSGTLLALTGLVHVQMADDTGSYRAQPLIGAFVWAASFLPLIYASLGPISDEGDEQRAIPR